MIFHSPNHSKARAAGIAALASAAVAACGFLQPAIAKNPPIDVRSAWSRPALDTAVVYATISNRSARPDTLDAVQAAVAKSADLHRSMAAHHDMSDMPGMPANGAMSEGMTMQALDAIPVPAHGTVELRPGGYHIMLNGLRHPLAAGQRFTVRLHFAFAGWVTAKVSVR